MADDGAVAPALGEDGLGRVVRRVHVHIRHASETRQKKGKQRNTMSHNAKATGSNIRDETGTETKQKNELLESNTYCG